MMMLSSQNMKMNVVGLDFINALAVTLFCLQMKTLLLGLYPLESELSLFILVAGISYTPTDSKATFLFTSHASVISANQICLQRAQHQLENVAV